VEHLFEFGWLTQVLFVVSALASLALLLVFLLRNLPLRRSLKNALGRNGPRPPEYVVGWYGVAELDAFIAAARTEVIGGRPALDVYRRPILIWNDIWFAVGLAGVLTFANLAIVPLMPLHLSGRCLAIICAVMGILYGASDILEDVQLERIFRSGAKVTVWDAFWASFWSQSKFAALFMAFPATIVLLVKYAHDTSQTIFYGVLKGVPLLLIVVAALAPKFARVLWACRVSLTSAFAGYALLLFVLPVKDLFADTTFGRHWYEQISFWSFVYAAVAIIALPVHFAARAAIEGRGAAHYIAPATRGWMIEWVPRVLGLIPVVAVALGIFGATIETRTAAHLDRALGAQYVLLSLGAWVTFGAVLLYVVARKRIVGKFLNGADSDRAKTVERICMIVTAATFVVLVCGPLRSTHHILRAALLPVLLGSGVLLFGSFGRLSDRKGKPIIAFIVAGAAVATALNSHFHDLRSLPGQPSTKAIQIPMPEAIVAWRQANHCPTSTDPDAEKKNKAACPPVLIVRRKAEEVAPLISPRPSLES
jgi:hypothetical protein